MSHAHHSTREGKKKPQHTTKEKKQLKLERKRAAEQQTPEVKIGKGNLKPVSQS